MKKSVTTRCACWQQIPLSPGQKSEETIESPTHTVFFSWQSDRPTKEGRNLIERALEAAVARVVEDAAVEEAPRDIAVDRDTAGEPGSPPIVDTIPPYLFRT